MLKYSLLKIDELLLLDHHYLTVNDECYYFMDYISNELNAEKSLIMNFKKSLQRKGRIDYKYKGIAINNIAHLFKACIPLLTSEDTILVPIPPSKAKSDPLYDDRVLKLLQLFCNGRPYEDVRELVYTKNTVIASHDTDNRPTPAEIMGNLVLDASMCANQKPNILLVDDLVTTGAHFKACKDIIQPAFPNSTIKGLFIARRKISPPDFFNIFPLEED